MAQYTSMLEWYRSQNQQFLDSCVSCGICVEVCPVYAMGDWGGLSPRALHDHRMAVLRDGVVSDVAYKFTFSCSGCAVCNTSCPENLDAFELTHLMCWAVNQAGNEAPDGVGLSPARPDSLPRVCAAIQTKPSEVRWLTAAPEDPPAADEVLFLGCSILALPDKVNTLLDILKLVTPDIPVLSGTELCCGRPALHRGEIDSAERSVRGLVEALARYRPKTVTCLCSGCYGKLRDFAPHFIDLPFRVRHVSSFLLEHIASLPVHPVAKTVTLHDSCGLGRIAGEYETVRRLLAAIPGLELVEMAKNRAEAPCCGALTQALMPEVAGQLLQLGLAEARNSGAGTLATICHGCQRHFSRHEPDYPFTVESYITLLGAALGIHHDDRLKRYVHYHDAERVIAESADCIAASGYPRQELEALVRRYFK